MKTTLGRAEIEAILPHREPFLLIDEVLELEPGDELQLECRLEAVRGPVGRGKATARVGDELAARGTLTFAVER